MYFKLKKTWLVTVLIPLMFACSYSSDDDNYSFRTLTVYLVDEESKSPISDGRVAVFGYMRDSKDGDRTWPIRPFKIVDYEGKVTFSFADYEVATMVQARSLGYIPQYQSYRNQEVITFFLAKEDWNQ